MTNTDIRERAEKISRLMDQAEDIKNEIADRFADAKTNGYTPAALRKAISIHRMDQKARARHDAAQMDLETYLAALEPARHLEAAE